MHALKLSQSKELVQLGNVPFKQSLNGVYRICNRNNGGELNGISYSTFELHNHDGVCMGICESNLLNWYQSKKYQLVSIKGYELEGDEAKLAHILHINPIDDLANLEVTQSLPRALCNTPSDLDRLIRIRRSIQSPALAKFLDTVLADEKIGLYFLQVSASRNFHHNEIGGLLAHSVEAAEIASQQKFDNQGERDIAVVASLLHDIGKVKTINLNLSSTTLGKMVGHDDLILEICALALKELDKDWIDASCTLRHIWSCATPGARYGFEQNSKLVNIVKFADKLSVDTYNENQAFKSNNQSTGLAWDGKKYYWRPTQETLRTGRNRLCHFINTL